MHIIALKITQEKIYDDDNNSIGITPTDLNSLIQVKETG